MSREPSAEPRRPSLPVLLAFGGIALGGVLAGWAAGAAPEPDGLRFALVALGCSLAAMGARRMARELGGNAAGATRRMQVASPEAAIALRVLGSVDTAEIVRGALDGIFEVRPRNRVGLLLRRRGQRRAELHVRNPAGARVSNAPVGVEALRELRKIFRQARDVLVLDADDPRRAHLDPSVRPGDAAVAAFPLFHKRDLLGVLFLDGVAAGTADARRLRELADHLAVALGNARMVEEIQFFAYFDELTGLPNRTLCSERLNEAIGRVTQRDGIVALLLVDLDHFARVNDSLGQDVGDELLKAAAERLGQCLRATDTLSRGEFPRGPELSRLGGDKFVALLEDMERWDATATVSRRILNELARPFECNGREIFLGASIGVAVYPQDGRDAETLLRNAYAAVAHAKEEGRGDFRLYESHMTDAAAQRLTIESRLRRALADEVLELHFQPLVDAQSGEVKGVEAVSRWTDPELGPISPAEFIGIAEETDLIVSFGEWTLRTALAQIQAIERAGLPPIYVSVNVSPRQFRDRDFVPMVLRLVEQADVDPQQVTLEITESLLMGRTEEAIVIMEQLRAIGLKLSIDDFGTGYSSLSYLKHLPIDCLKIDQSFVRGVGTCADDEAICSAVIALSHILGLSVVAEGVEKREQLELLREGGCDLIQGYFFSRPVPGAQLIELLRHGFADRV